LCGAAGIAAGSFYAFYSDKSDLFFDIVSRENEGLSDPADRNPSLALAPY